MTKKVDAYEMPQPRYVEVEMFNIEWDTKGATPNRPLPKRVTATVNMNDGNPIAQAITKAKGLTGFDITDMDFRPIDYSNIIGPPEGEASFDDTLEYEGEVFDYRGTYGLGVGTHVKGKL